MLLLVLREIFVKMGMQFDWLSEFQMFFSSTHKYLSACYWFIDSCMALEHWVAEWLVGNRAASKLNSFVIVWIKPQSLELG